MKYLCTVCGGTGERFRGDGEKSCHFCDGVGRLNDPFIPNEKSTNNKEETTYEKN